MIRNEEEYRQAVERVTQEDERLTQYQQNLVNLGLKDEEINRALEPIKSFHLQLHEEVAAYERLKRREFQDVRNFQGSGQLLVSLRISLGLSQRELAKRLDVDEAQVSRDERNEYHNIGIDRAAKILKAMGVTLRSTVEPLPDRDAA